MQIQFNMVRASALFIVLVVSFVVGAITSSIVFATFYYRLEVADLLIYKKLNTNLNSAIAELKVMPEESLRDSLAWDLYGDEQDSVSFKVQPWGIFEIAHVRAFFNSKQIHKTFMYGYTLDKESKAALCLAKHDRGLRISGNTIIVGDCYLPQGVVVPANIDRQFYQGPAKFIEGKIFQSTHVNMELNSAVLKHINDLLHGEKFNHSIQEDTSYLYNSFSLPTHYVNYNQVNIQNTSTIKGNIVLYSDKPLTLPKNIYLEDIIVVAPSVIVPENYKASIQIICTDSITVKNKAQLLYPSALILVKEKNTTGMAHITIKKDAEVRGVICAYSTFVNEQNVFVNINKAATVQGQVFSNAYVDCQGTVKGGIISNMLFLNTSLSKNENCLVDAKIDVSQRSSHFIGSKLLPVSKQRGIVKWL